ncbi:MAG TPA: hypothetical protein VGL91_20435 [Acidobacteriota bacterium]
MVGPFDPMIGQRVQRGVRVDGMPASALRIQQPRIRVGWSKFVSGNYQWCFPDARPGLSVQGRRKAENAEGRKQNAESRRRKAEGGKRKAESRRQKAEGRKQKAEGGKLGR